MPRSRLKWKFALTLPDERLITLPWIGVPYYGLSHFPLIRSYANCWASEMFGSAVQNCLGTCDVFNGWCGAALRSVRRAKAQGAVTVLCTGSVHIAYQKELIEAEYSKFGLKRVVTHPFIVEKGTQDFLEADHTVVPSTIVMRTLLDKGIERSKISIVSHPLTECLPVSPKRDSVFRIIAVGRLEFRKGIQYLLEAMRQLRLPNSELLLVGGVEAEFTPILKKFSGHFRLTGYVPA